MQSVHALALAFSVRQFASKNQLLLALCGVAEGYSATKGCVVNQRLVPVSYLHACAIWSAFFLAAHAGLAQATSCTDI